jgi:hypothetical protein
MIEDSLVAAKRKVREITKTRQARTLSRDDRTETRSKPSHGIGTDEQAAADRDDRAFFEALAIGLLTRFEEDPSIPRLILRSALDGHEPPKVALERQLVWNNPRSITLQNERATVPSGKSIPATECTRSARCSSVTSCGSKYSEWQNTGNTIGRKSLKKVTIFLDGIRK